MPGEEAAGARRNGQWKARLRGLLGKGKEEAKEKQERLAAYRGTKSAGAGRLFRLKKKEGKEGKEDDGQGLRHSGRSGSDRNEIMCVVDSDVSVDGGAPEQRRLNDKKRSPKISGVARRSVSNVQSMSSTVSTFADNSLQLNSSTVELESCNGDEGMEETKNNRMMNWITSPTKKPVAGGVVSQIELSGFQGDRGHVSDQAGSVQDPSSPVPSPQHSPLPSPALPPIPFQAISTPEIHNTEAEYEEQVVTVLPLTASGFIQTVVDDSPRKRVGFMEARQPKSTSMRISLTDNTNYDEMLGENNFLEGKRTQSVSTPNTNWFNLPVNPSARGETGDIASLSREASNRKKLASKPHSRNNSFKGDLRSPRSPQMVNSNSRSLPKISPTRLDGEERNGGSGLNSPAHGLRESMNWSPKSKCSGSSPSIAVLDDVFREARASDTGTDVDEYSQFMSERNKSIRKLISTQKIFSKDNSMRNLKTLLVGGAHGSDSADDDEDLNGETEDVESSNYAPFDLGLSNRSNSTYAASDSEVLEATQVSSISSATETRKPMRKSCNDQAYRK